MIPQHARPVLEGLDFVAALINGACRILGRDSAAAQKVQEAVEHWARNKAVLRSELLPHTR